MIKLGILEKIKHNNYLGLVYGIVTYNLTRDHSDICKNNNNKKVLNNFRLINNDMIQTNILKV